MRHPIMIDKLTNWLKAVFSRTKPGPTRAFQKPGAHLGRTTASAAKSRPLKKPPSVADEPHLDGKIESLGPGKNVLIRNKYVREDTGTHETLTILDDSMIDSGEETGLDPYNTGEFDRSKNWDNRFRK